MASGIVAEEHRRGELVDVARDRVGHVAGVRVAGQPRVGVDRDEQERRVVGQVNRFEAAIFTAHPRPTNGICVAITVMNSTFASSGRLAM